MARFYNLTNLLMKDTLNTRINKQDGTMFDQVGGKTNMMERLVRNDEFII